MKLAFLGLGVMGFPMAGHLIQAGHELTVFNRNSERSALWLRQYAHPQQTVKLQSASTIAQACHEADVIFSCLGNDADVREVMLGEAGVLSVVKSGALVCDHTTTSAMLAQELNAQFSAKGVSFLDAPVSGGQVGAENGKLSIMLGGTQADFNRVEVLLQCYAKSLNLIGESGSGQLAKMVNQICICGILQGLSEALYFGEQVQLDMEKVIAAISGGAAQSWQMENRASTMLQRQFNFGFAVDWMRKDLSFVLAEAHNRQIDLALVRQVDANYAKVQELGGNRWDTSSLMALFPKI